MIALTLPFPPSKNRLHRRVGNLTILSREAREYREDLRALMLRRRADWGVWPIMTEPVVVTMTFYRPSKIGDLDGRIPWLLDCLQGLAYEDDKQVVAIHAYRHDDKVNPRVEVVIERLEEAAAV